ncbi:MAG TPA: ATP-dependent helicase [Blastocatellia bacterium]
MPPLWKTRGPLSLTSKQCHILTPLMVKEYVIKRAAPAASQVDYGRDLSDEQYRVVSAGPGPILVIAGAGSGKTRTTTYRVARLLESGVYPSRILLATFTNKAAREMIRRVEGLVQSDARKIWAGTFHSIANRILRRHAEDLGYHSNFTILDAQDTSDLLDVAIQEAGVDQKSKRFPKAAVIGEMISAANCRCLTVAGCVEEIFSQFKSLASAIEYVAGIYQAQKLRRNAMDYDDLLLNCRRLLADDSDTARYWAGRFEHVLIDEYQDTSKIQGELVDLLASGHRNIMVVGDDAQSIFGWRGAHFANIYQFKERYPDATEYRLETNYRSRPEILMIANASIRNNFRQFPKQLEAVREPAGGAPGLVPLKNANQQAAFVAGRVLDLREEGIELSQMAVLYRSHWQSLELQIELVRRGIPYVVRSGVRFFEQAHIRDVVSYLRILTNPWDELAWKRVLKLIAGIGPRVAARLWEKVAASPDPLQLILSDGFSPSGRARAGWRDFAGLVSRLSSMDTADRPGVQIETIMSCGYSEHLRTAYDNAELRAEDIRQLANYAAQFESTESFLSDLALVNTERFAAPNGMSAEDVVKAGDQDERLVLSSVHQAKGLEWKVVFIIWAADGKFPSARSLRDPDAEEEERRLFYVATTRAKDELYFCYPVIQDDYVRKTFIQKPSRFITEIPRQLFQLWSVKEEGYALDARVKHEQMSIN